MKVKITILTPVVTFCVGLVLFSAWLLLNPISVFADLASCTAKCGGGVSVSCGGGNATTCTALDNQGCVSNKSGGESRTCADARKKPGDDMDVPVEEGGDS